MIKILRPAEPAYLKSAKILNAKKQLEIRFKSASNQERFRFDTSLLSPIRSDLMRMCGGKCAYCETRISGSFGDIENFRPKGGARGFNAQQYAPRHYWWLAYEWENLLIACQICNQKYKRDLFPLEDEKRRAKIGARGDELLDELPLLIDPTIDDPGEHLKFGEDGVVLALSPRGKATVEILGLNRTELVDNRRQVARQLRMTLMSLETLEFLPESLMSFIVAEIERLFSDSPSQEYAAIQRDVFDAWYEQNSSKWEAIKAAQNDSSETKRTVKSSVSGSSEVISQIRKVESQLTALKRFSIKSVEIENFKSIEKLFLEIPPLDESGEKEPWLLLLGDNAIGKSSILQAIALALSSKNQIKKLRLNPPDYLRRGAQSGQVVIHSYEHDQPITLNLDKKGFRTNLNEALSFVLGYGSTRLLPKGGIKPETNKEPYFNIKNLFDYSTALGNPNEWLTGIEPGEFNERVAPAFFDLLALRSGDRLYVENGKIVIQQYGEDHELENNSDGYKNITALVSDIMQTLSLEKSNYHNSHGIVLIDEIGNHLHPRWRLKIVGALRKAFPKLQFIVTTHEPLCLRGLAHGEVVVLVRDQENRIQALDKSLLPDHNLLRIDQLLTSDLFGLINVTDEETEKTYEEFYELLSKPAQERTEEEDRKISEISSALSRKEMLGSTPVMQATFEVVNEVFAKNIREQGFKTKEELKQETVAEVKQILNEKEIDWL